MTQKIDILAFAAHPDDVELACSGSLIAQKKLGKTIGIIDLTTGQLGTRGTPEIRVTESEKSASILGLDIRENLEMEDGFFTTDKEHILKVVEMIRKYRPTTVLCNAPKDRHPDHGKGAELVIKACFYSGLKKIESYYPAHRPINVYHYIQDYYLDPTFVVDITDTFETKMKSILAFGSQFYDPNNKEEEETPISSKDFLSYIESRAREMGRKIGVEYGEGFITTTPLQLMSL